MSEAPRTVNDPWLEPLLPEIRARLDGRPLRELGCGDGIDTAVLVDAGCRVIGIDRSEAALDAPRVRAPGAELHCRDLREPFPLGDGDAGVVIASLSLHNFPWDELARAHARRGDDPALRVAESRLARRCRGRRLIGRRRDGDDRAGPSNRGA